MTEEKHIVCPHCNVTNRIPENRLGDGPNCGECKQALFTGQPINLTSTSFSDHITNSDIPIVVDFWAPWCGPCKMMAPAFSQAAEELEPDFRLAKVDTEAEQSLGMQYGIRSIPTIAIFQNGKEVARQAGAMSAANIVQWVKSNG